MKRALPWGLPYCFLLLTCTLCPTLGKNGQEHCQYLPHPPRDFGSQLHGPIFAIQECWLDGICPALFRWHWCRAGQMVNPLSLQCTFPNHLPAATNILPWPIQPPLKLLWSQWVQEQAGSAHGTLGATPMDFFFLKCLSHCVHWLVILP